MLRRAITAFNAVVLGITTTTTAKLLTVTTTTRTTVTTTMVCVLCVLQTQQINTEHKHILLYFDYAPKFS